MLKESLDRLAGVRRSVTDGTADLERGRATAPTAAPRSRNRGVRRSASREYRTTISTRMPDGFTLSPKLARQWERRAAVLDAPDGRIDWAHAETLAFAAILADGTPIRLTGQDAERGTFSQRHLVLHDPATDATLHAAASAAGREGALRRLQQPALRAGRGRLRIWLQRAGARTPGALGRRSSAISPTAPRSSSTSSSPPPAPSGGRSRRWCCCSRTATKARARSTPARRLERYLQLSAQDNIRVANCTTAAQYFHLLRRQAALLSLDPRPLIVMTPKSLLRNPLASSAARRSGHRHLPAR